MDIHVNWLAVVVSVLIMMVLGFLWYSPMLFGDRWAQLFGKPTFKDLMAGDNSPLPIFLSVLFSIFVCVVLAVFVGLVQAFSYKWGAFVGLLAWLGFVLPVLGQTYVYQKRPWIQTAIESGYYLVTLVLVGVLLGWWF